MVEVHGNAFTPAMLMPTEDVMVQVIQQIHENLMAGNFTDFRIAHVKQVIIRGMFPLEG